jgi:hypothetical protein
MTDWYAVLPTYLQPKLVLFMSVDLVGSTALKQRHSLKLDPASASLTEHWLQPISNFFSQFGRHFEAAWLEYAQKTRLKLAHPEGPPPEFWKGNGDEMIFTKVVVDRRDLYGCLLAWYNAIRSYRAENVLKSGALDVKSAVWLAGFPIANSEIVFARTVNADDSKYAGDSKLRAYELLDRWYEKDANRSNLVRDFVGRSIDTGFRLAGLATPQQLIMSIEVAWLVADQKPASGKERKALFPQFDVKYSGRIPLKGVLGGSGYPVFWIDTMSSDALLTAEAKLVARPELTPTNIAEFASEFLDSHSQHIMKPFMIAEPADQHGDPPLHYKEHVLALANALIAEKQRYSLEEDGLSGKEPENVNDTAITPPKEQPSELASKVAPKKQA